MIGFVLSSSRRKLVLGVLILGLAFMLPMVFGGKVNAFPLVPDPGSGGEPAIPADTRARFMECDVDPGENTHWLSWLSAPGQPSALVHTVDYGTASTNLHFQFASAVCHNHSPYTNYAREHIVGHSAGLSTSAPLYLDINYNTAGGTQGTYRRTSKVMTFAPAGGFTETRTYTFEINVKTVNRVLIGGSYRYFCVNAEVGDPLLSISNLNDISRCYTFTVRQNFRIVVRPRNNAPSGRYTAVCGEGNRYGEIVVTANAADSDGDSVSIVTSVSGSGTNPPNYVGSARNNISIGTVTRPPNGGTYTISGTISDGTVSVNMASTSVTCSRPPTTWECNFQIIGLSGGNIEIGVPFTVRVTIRNTSAPYALGMNQNTHPVSISASPSGLSGIGPSSSYAYQAGSGPGSIPPTTATVDDTGIIASEANRYEFTVRVGGTACFGSANVVTGVYPYLKEFGGDVWVGGNFVNSSSGSCEPPMGSNGSIFAHNTSSDPENNGRYIGSSAQLTVTSLMSINQFSSAGNRDAAVPSGNTYSPKGLTFANNNSAFEYGGGFGANEARCITDYYNSTRDTGLGNAVFTGSLSANTGRIQYVMSGGTVGAGGAINVPNGTQVAVFSSGDVFIRNNIQFESGASSVNQLPNFALVVCGNIYIDSSVTVLDGLYIAQSGRVGSDGRCIRSADSVNGTIYTCATALGVACNQANVFSEGNRQLTINGGLIANRIKWLRILADRSLSTASFGEVPNFGTGRGTGASEVVNFTPAMYLAPSGLADPDESPDGDGEAGTSEPYDAIRSLPPIF